MPAFIAYTLPQVALLAWALLRQDEPDLVALATALFFYLIMLTVFARNANQQFVRSQRLSSENELLVEQLHTENLQRDHIIQQRTADLETTNLSLEREVKELKQAQTQRDPGPLEAGEPDYRDWVAQGSDE
ncbi:MAG: C4-dicarboxylate-specific signal transduction histidine kinase [Halieaceae bacterium]|jgi:C4-dicarboxylate-specific signal transduction histidine kinase